jgi:hypothetical protein
MGASDTPQEGEWGMWNPRIKLRGWVLLTAALLVPPLATGCDPLTGMHILVHPFSMGIATPIAVPPWTTENLERKYLWNKLDYRTVIMPPIVEGFPPPRCEDPPDEASVLRAIVDVTRGVPYIYEEFRDDIEIITEKIVDRIDPPRFYPLVGPAQLHHCHYKCTVYYVETVESGYPFAVQLRQPRVQVVYIDKDHLHLFTGGDPTVQRQVTRDLTNN